MLQSSFRGRLRCTTPAPHRLRRCAHACCPPLSLAVLLAAIFCLQPRAMSYVGLNLLLNLAMPIALATIAQMFVITVNDLDLSIGAFVGFVACVAATWLRDDAAARRRGAGRLHRRLCALSAR